MTWTRPFFIIAVVVALFAGVATRFSYAAAERVQLAADGTAAFAVVVSANASARTKAAAATLTDYLGRISEARFELKAGDADSGVVVGKAADFPNLAVELPDPVKDPTKREDYVLRSNARGLYVVGATDLAVEHAVWDLLHRLGYRQYFPGEHWEVVPRVRDLSIAVDVREHPSYYSRRIWYGFGAWDYAAKPYADWCAKNRAVSGIELRSGHAYDGILHDNKQAFAAHPEYLGLVNGQRKSTKFCISNPGLRKLVVQNALRQFDKTPAMDSISVDPSDGGNWCECAECAKIGSVTDRALTLANDVAAAVDARYAGKWVGMYAYNYHSPPPNIRAHPRVVISVATAFIKGGLSVDDLIAGWSAKCDTLGIREYYSVNTWDRDQPAAARGANISYLTRTIPHFHQKGARFLSAESSDNWGPNGLGYYLAARMLWDVKEAGNADALSDDFLTRAFGPAKEPMREFYKQLDGSEPHLAVSDQIGRMFQSLAEARKLAGGDPAVLARLDDLLLYVRYVDLYQRYAKAQGEKRQAAFEALIRHTYRMRATMLVHAKALYRDLAGRDKSVTIPADATWNVPEPKNPWKSSKPFAAEELAAYQAEGANLYPLAKIDFKPLTFSEDLVSAAKLKLPDVPTGSLGAARGKQTFYTRIDAAPAEISLLITGGQIAHYRDRGNVKVDLWKIGGASQTGEQETNVASDRSVPPDGKEHAVTLAVKEPGLYKLMIDDGMDKTLVKWNSRLPLVVKSTVEEPLNRFYSAWTLYFYVPKGTKVIGLFGGGRGDVRDSADKPVFSLKDREPSYYSVPVAEGHDGKLWSIRGGSGAVHLLTVPPYFARSAGELLLPRDVVQRDGEK